MPSRSARRFASAMLPRGFARVGAGLAVGLLVLGATAAHALPLVVVTSSLADGTAGVGYSGAIQASSGTVPYGWTIVGGSLPAGIVLDGGTGALSGSATLAGTRNFIVLATDAVGDTATRALSLTIAPGAASALSFTTGPSAVVAGVTMTPAVQVRVSDAFGNAVAGTPVSLALVGSGTLSGGAAVASDGFGVATFAALSVDAPGGKQVTASSGALTPATSSAFTVSCPAISVAPASLPAAAPGNAYSQTLSASGGIAPYAFAVTAGALPPGLTLSSAGLLAGTPSATGVYSFTVTATATGGCTGSRAYSVTVPAVPAAVSDLAATRLTSGNDADGTARIQISFTPTAFTSTVEVYRAAFGGYPRYDDAGGLAPPTPSYPPGAPWVLTAVSASGQTDEPVTRDVWSYVVFVKNSLGQVSAVSNQTRGTTNYALGDVSDGVTAGAGDNLVNDLDISLLGAHYGISGAAVLSAGVSYLDVGPTVDLSVTTRPFTDGRIDFEDLVVFATNYGAVSGPAALIAAADASARAATAAEVLSLDAPARVAPGETFDAVVRMEAAGRVQGLSAELGWDPALAEPVAVTGSGWVEAQHGVVWSARPGTFDAVLLGARARGLAGAGDLARVTFRARAAGEPAIRLVRVLARDAANRPLAANALSFGAPAATPAHTLLLAPAPNPAHGASTLSFALAMPGDAELAIYSVDGRRVRTLARGVFAAGTYRFTWQGEDELHRTTAPGIYFAQLVTGGTRYSRTLVRLR